MFLHRRLYKIFITCFIITLNLSVSAQCKDFSVNTCKPGLYPFIHDGIYNAHVLSTGESAELFKTFFAKQNYRLLVCKPSNIPVINMIVMDTKRNVLYTKQIKDDIDTWDFNLESSQQLIVDLNILPTKTSESGCVSVLIGLEENP